MPLNSALDTQVLIEEDAEVDAVGYIGRTPLFYAASNNEIEVGKVYLEPHFDKLGL